MLTLQISHKLNQLLAGNRTKVLNNQTCYSPIIHPRDNFDELRNRPKISPLI